MRPFSFTRAELHALVWSKPLKKLAPELGLTDVGLKKLCKRHHIPTPPQGHWISIHHGRARPIIALPHRPEDDDPDFRIGFSASLNPASARTDIAALKSDARAKPSPDDFPTRATDALHPALIATARTLRAAKPDRDGFIHARGEKDLCGLLLSIEHSERILAFLDALFRALTGRNITISANGIRMIAARGPDAIEFRIAGKTAQRLYRPTEAERAQDKERERRIQLGFGRDEERSYPDTHSFFTGRYALFIESWTPGVRKSWHDTSNQSLESLFHEIVAGIEACLIAQAALRQEREQRWKREQDEAAARARAQQRQAREEQRARFLAHLLALEAEALRLESWLARGLPGDAVPAPWPSFRAWAQARLERIRIQSEPEQVNASLARQSDLFPDPDPLADLDAPIQFIIDDPDQEDEDDV